MWIRILGSAAVVVVFAFVSQLIIVAMFGMTEICEENGCSLGCLGGLSFPSLLQCILYLISAATIWKISEPREVVATAGADNSIHVNTTELPDGSNRGDGKDDNQFGWNPDY
jgi:hypothetical protein